MGTIYHKKEIFGGNPLIETIGVGGGYAPIGTIIAYMGTTAPQDYLICNGGIYNIADYTQLAHFFETQFGSINYFGGNGTTTFAVPDLRGEFLRGTGTNSHTDSGNGSNVGVHQNATKIPRFATASATGAPITYGKAIEPTLVDWYDRSTENKYYYFPAGSVSEGTATTPVKVFSSRPTNTSVLYCIKAICAGEVYSTDEKVVGTWIDGKPLYQITIIGTMPDVTTDGTYVSVNIPHNIPNIDLPFIVESFVLDYADWPNTSTLVRRLPYTTNVGNQLKASIGKTLIQYASAIKAYNGSTIYTTIRYTKTTD